MKRPHILMFIAAGAVVVSGVSGDDFVTYESAVRSITADCPEGQDSQAATAFEPFNALIQFGAPPSGDVVLVSQSSAFGLTSFSAMGQALSFTPDQPLGSGACRSEFVVTLSIDETSAFSLNGLMHGRGIYILTGPGLQMAGLQALGSEDFCQSHITGPGSYNFLIILEAASHADSPLWPNFAHSEFELDFVLEPARVADVTGPNGPGHWDGCVDALDLLLVIAEWGDPCGPPCHADITGPGGVPDGVVDAMDFVMVIADWG